MTTISASTSAEPTRTTVTASDGVTLAVHAYTEIDRQRPTVLAIHGYPDDLRTVMVIGPCSYDAGMQANGANIKA